MKPINTLCVQNVELLNVTRDDACSYHWALRGQLSFVVKYFIDSIEYFYFSGTLNFPA
jgi:hypothetical protein